MCKGTVKWFLDTLQEFVGGYLSFWQNSDGYNRAYWRYVRK